MKAIYIDSKNKKINLVEYSGNANEITNKINARILDRFYIENNCAYIDDEGLSNNDNSKFLFNGNAYSGNSLIVGILNKENKEDGNDYDIDLSLDRAKELITFPTFFEQEWADNFFTKSELNLSTKLDNQMTIQTLLDRLYVATGGNEILQKKIKSKILYLYTLDLSIIDYLNFLSEKV